MCNIASFETRSSPGSLAATLAALPSISEIPFPRFLIQDLRELRVLRGELQIVSASRRNKHASRVRSPIREIHAIRGFTLFDWCPLVETGPPWRIRG